MDSNEVREISYSFLQAWQEFFGANVTYIPPLATVPKDPVYDEIAGTVLDTANAVEFTGSFKDNEELDKLTATGYSYQNPGTITAVTQQLVDLGIYPLQRTGQLEYTDAYGITKKFKIVEIYQKVQFLGFKIFTKIVVEEI